MAGEHVFARGETLPSWWANAIQEFLSVASPSFGIGVISTNTIQVYGGAGDDRASVAIDGRWRYNDVSVTAVVSGSTGTRYIYVTAEETDIVSSPDPFTDVTDRSFGLEARAAGAGPPTTDLWRLIGTLQWSGATIDETTVVNYGSDWIFQQRMQAELDLKVDGSDGRLTNSRAPSGAAGGVLSGTYPNPGFAALEAWHVVGDSGEPPFQNGWSWFTPKPRFYKHLDRVYLDGTATRGAGTSSGVPIFTLPAGYRPAVSSNSMLRIGAGAGLGYDVVTFEIRQNGEVIPQSPATSRLDFCGVSFRAEF